MAREIEAMHETLRRMVAELGNLDATIIQFDPDFKVETIKPEGNDSYRELAEKLTAIGIPETERNIANKISRGGFTTAFFIQCLSAVACANLRLDDV